MLKIIKIINTSETEIIFFNITCIYDKTTKIEKQVINKYELECKGKGGRERLKLKPIIYSMQYLKIIMGKIGKKIIK